MQSDFDELSRLEGLLREGGFNTSHATQLLSVIRKTKARRPELVVKYAVPLLKKSTFGGAQVWDVREQLFLAALDTHQTELAEQTLSKIMEHFPNSVRAKRLEGMWFEREGSYDKAWQLYEEILKEDKTFANVWKRKICISKAMGRYGEAVASLNEYLSIFMTDVEAWQELADLYLQEQQYEQAKFCYEELILHMPHNYLLFMKMGEILYTLGDYVSARKFYCQSLELNKGSNNLRSLFGLTATISAIISHPRSRSEDKIYNADLYLWARKQIQSIYTECKNDSMNVLVAKVLAPTEAA